MSKKLDDKTTNAFEALGSPSPLSYNKTIEAAELATANDETYGPVIDTLRERTGTATDSLERGLRALQLRLPDDPKKL